MMGMSLPIRVRGGMELLEIESLRDEDTFKTQKMRFFINASFALYLKSA